MQIPKQSLWTHLSLGLASVLFSLNLLIGWKVSGLNATEAPVDLHLSFAILGILALIIGSFGRFRLFNSRERWLEHKLASEKSLDAKKEWQDWREAKTQLQIQTIVPVALVVLSVLTGTTSQAGKLSLVHLALGLGLAGFSWASFLKSLKD